MENSKFLSSNFLQISLKTLKRSSRRKLMAFLGIFINFTSAANDDAQPPARNLIREFSLLGFMKLRKP